MSERERKREACPRGLALTQVQARTELTQCAIEVDIMAVDSVMMRTFLLAILYDEPGESFGGRFDTAEEFGMTFEQTGNFEPQLWVLVQSIHAPAKGVWEHMQHTHFFSTDAANRDS